MAKEVTPEQIQMLDEMVREVNQICVEEEEILSDHAYYYDRSEDLLTM